MWPAPQARAHSAFHEHGCILLRSALPLATIEAMHCEYISQFGTLDLAAMRDRRRNRRRTDFFG
jgi:hypothetical protein